MAIQDPAPRYMTTGETARLLRISTRTVRNLIHRHEVPAVRIGGQYRVDVASLDALLSPDTNGKAR